MCRLDRGDGVGLVIVWGSDRGAGYSRNWIQCTQASSCVIVNRNSPDIGLKSFVFHSDRNWETHEMRQDSMRADSRKKKTCISSYLGFDAATVFTAVLRTLCNHVEQATSHFGLL